MDDDLRLRVEERLGLEIDRVVRIDHGWDSVAYDVNGSWIIRVPRRPEVRESLRLEAELLAPLAPELPVPVPLVTVFEDSESFFAVHRKLQGRSLRSDVPVLARQLGGFLAALHSSAAGKAALPETSAGDWLDAQVAFAERCDAALALLASAERRQAQAMFEKHLSRTPHSDLVLVHGDLGPTHILCSDERLTAVIDWSDARIGDPALDFAWPLHGPGEEFADTLLGAYVAQGGRVDPTFRERALSFHRLGPWHEVVFGLERGRPDLVESGLAGVRQRLP